MLFRSALLGSSLVQLCRAAPAALHQPLLSTCAAPHQASCRQAPGSHTAGVPWWRAAAAVLGLAATVGGTAVALADSKGPISIQAASTPQPEAEGDGVSAGGKLLLSLATRQRIFFKYEKRIRDLSTLEKIFEYFATNEKDGRKAMNAQDVVRALVPTYPPVGSTVERAGFLDGERGHSQTVKTAHDAIISFFDHNKDGVIGFDEFVLIVIALSVPEKDVEVVFDVIDLDNNGVLDADEFMQVLRQLELRAGIQHKFVGRVGQNSVDGGRRSAFGGQLHESESEMTEKLFREQGRTGISLDKFRNFLKKLQEGMIKLEFAHYDVKGQGYMKGCDFANSLVTAADIRTVDRYLDKAQSLPAQLADARITFKQFQDMNLLRRHMYMLSFALDFCAQIERPLSKDDFAELLNKTLKVKLAPAVLDILFVVFGDDQGLLDGPAFVSVMKSRNRVPGYKKGQGLGVGGEADSVSPLLGWWNCISNCSFGHTSSHHQHTR